MECTVPVEVHLATEHADVGSLERTISAALRGDRDDDSEAARPAARWDRAGDEGAPAARR